MISKANPLTSFYMRPTLAKIPPDIYDGALSAKTANDSMLFNYISQSSIIDVCQGSKCNPGSDQKNKELIAWF